MKIAISHGKIGCTLMLLLIGGVSIAKASGTGEVLVREDDEVCRLLLMMNTPAHRKAAHKELETLSKDQLRKGLAYALVRHDTRERALRYIRTSFDEPGIAPAVIQAMKWGNGPERLRAIRILQKAPSKAAIPVLLRYVLDDSYTVISRGGPPGGSYEIDSITSVFVEGSSLLHRLSDGNMGSDRLSDRRLLATWEQQELLLPWRQWWNKNSGTILPEWKPERHDFQTKEQVSQWCTQRIDSWPEVMADDAQKAFDDFSMRIPKWALSRPDAYIGGFSCPKDLAGPVVTPVLIRAVLITGGGGVAPGEVADKAALQTHRVALLCLSRSRDWDAVTAFLDWGLANGEIRDPQAAAYTLGRMNSPNPAEVLKKMLSTKISDKTRLEIARSLGKTKVAQAAKPLCKMLAGDDVPKGIHQLAHRSLREIGRAGLAQVEAVTESLRPLLKSERDEHVLAALHILGNIGRENARDAIEASMADFNDKTRPVAEKMIGLIERHIQSGKKR